MNFNFLSTKENEKVENYRLMKSLYGVEMNDEWCYEDELIHMNGYSYSYIVE